MPLSFLDPNAKTPKGGAPKASAAKLPGPKGTTSSGPTLSFLGGGTPSKSAAATPKGGGNKNFLLKGLSLIDKPRAIIASTGKELLDLSQGEGFSGSEWKKQIGSNISVGDILKEETSLPSWARAGLGFVGDVALDPLTYVGGAGVLRHGGKGVARELANPKVIEALAAKGIGKEVAERGALTALSKGGARVAPELLETIGEVTGKTARPGFYLKTGRIAGDVRLGGERLAVALNDVNAGARKAFVNTKVGTQLAAKLGGKAGELGLIKDIRNGDMAAFHKLENMKLMDRTRRVAEGQLTDSLNKVLKPFKNDSNLLTDMRRTLEGDAEAASRLAAIPHEAGTLLDEAGSVRQWLDAAADRVGLPKIENYFPRSWSPELKAELKTSMRTGKVGEVMKRELVDGSEWMGETLRGTPAEIRDQIEEIARTHFGNNYKRVFSDSVPDTLGVYAKEIARREAKLAAREGLLESLGNTAARRGKAVVGAKPIKATGAAAAATGSLPERVGQVALDFNAGPRKAALARVAEESAARQAQSRTLADVSLKQAQRTMEATHDRTRQALLGAAPWRSELAEIDKQLARLEKVGTGSKAARRARAAEVAEAGGSAFDDLGPLRERRAELQRRIDITETLVENDRNLAQTVFDSAAAAVEKAEAPDPQAIAQRIREQEMVLSAFPADNRSIPAIRKSLKNTEAFNDMLSKAARTLSTGEDVDDVVEALARAGRVTANTNGFLKAFDRATGILKQYMILSPGFHIRNAMGGEFNNELAGVAFKSKREWSRIWNKARWGANPDRLNAADRAIYDRVMETGVVRQTQAEDVVGRAGTGSSWNPLSRNFKPVKWSYGTSEGVEGYLRGSLAYDVLERQKGTVDMAADQVIKFHYDYDDLSGFERGVMKRIIPFYTWTRKNLPLQLEQMAKQPAKYTAYLKAKHEIESLSPEEGVVPGYFGDLGAIRMPFKLGAGQAYFSPDLPFRDVAEYIRPDEPLRGLGLAIGAANPILKLPVERWANKKYFTNQPFYPGQSPAPGSWSAIPGLMPALAAIGAAEKGADGGYYMDQRNVYSVEQIAPVLARIHRLMPSGEGDEYMKQRQTTNVLSFFGLGLQSNTPEAQKAELKKRTAALNAAVKKQKDLGYVK